MEKTDQEPYCGGLPCEAPIASAVDVLAGRWTVAVIEAAHFAGPGVRFKELQRRISGVSPKELTRHLANLVDQGVLARASGDAEKSKGELEGRTGYQLTERGQRLLAHMQALGEWARESHSFDAAPSQKASWIDPIRPPCAGGLIKS